MSWLVRLIRITVVLKLHFNSKNLRKIVKVELMKQFMTYSGLLTTLLTFSQLGQAATPLDISQHNRVCEARTYINDGYKAIGRFYYEGNGTWKVQNSNDLSKNRTRIFGEGSVTGLYKIFIQGSSRFRFIRIDPIYHNPSSVKIVKTEKNKSKTSIVSEVASTIKAWDGGTAFSSTPRVELIGLACHLFWRSMNSDQMILAYGELSENYSEKMKDEVTTMLFLNNIIHPDEGVIDIENVRQQLVK